jgi:hypothetical protein
LLKPEQQEQVYDWLVKENYSVADVQQRVQAEFGVVLSAGQLAVAYRLGKLRYITDRLAQAAAVGNTILHKTRRSQTDSLQALVDLLTRLALLKSAEIKPDWDDAMRIVVAAMSVRRQQAMEQKVTLSTKELELEREKFERLVCGRLIDLRNSDKIRDILDDGQTSRDEKIAQLRSVIFAQIEAVGPAKPVPINNKP